MPGRRKAEARKLYLAMTAAQAFALSVVFTINLVYQVKQVGLNPLQLVLIGTTLELTALLTEIPTGVVADVYSRRLSVILGFLLLGGGFILEGALPLYEALLLAQVITGLGYTFLSGATSAWIVDEIGQERAGEVFLRSAQFSQIAGFGGIFCSVALASLSLQLAIVTGGALLLLLALALALFMPESGFQRAPSGDRESWRALFTTFRGGLRLVRSRRILALLMLAAALHGAFSEGYDRLWVARLLSDFSLPPLGQLDEILWFGLISAVSMPLALGATELLRRRLDLSDGSLVARTLVFVYALMIASVLLFTLAESFALALLGLWLTAAARSLRNPLLETWVNQHSDSRLRATVLSIHGQADAFGQIAGGPVVGAVGLFSSVRAAIALSVLMLAPIVPLFRSAGKSETASGG